MENLWHELIHTRQKPWLDITGKNSADDLYKKRVMETSTQWYARRTYHYLLRQLGGMPDLQQKIISDGYGYEDYIRRFDMVISCFNIEEKALLSEMKKMMKTELPRNYKDTLKDIFQRLSGVERYMIDKVIEQLDKSYFKSILASLGF